VNVVHAFNPGYTKAFHESIKVENPIKKELDKKVNIHRVKKDIVSAWSHNETAFDHKDKNADMLDRHSLDTFTNEEI
jgi:hypothetical protein